MKFPWTRTEGWAQCRYPRKGKGYWHYWRPFDGPFSAPLCGSQSLLWRRDRRLHRKPKGTPCPICARRKK